MLAPYAVTESNSQGRQYEAEPARDRNAFQRDYTRISHSRAFRRLQGKTQVFSNTQDFNDELGDLYRTRLTHSLEVEQLSRSVARQLFLNEDLAGVLAVAHDIGHPPFGHLGQDVLNTMLIPYGLTFEHNEHALRLVDVLESPYREHPGLNLMFETREGLLKHCTRKSAQALGAVAARHLDGTSPTLEAQVVDWCDAIAYLHADLEDAFTMGLITADGLLDVPGYREAFDRVRARHGDFAHPTDAVLQSHDSAAVSGARADIHTILRDMFSSAANALVVGTQKNIGEIRPETLEDIRNAPLLAGFTEEHKVLHRALKDFSRRIIYTHPKIAEIRAGQAEKLEQLFRFYETDPAQMRGRGPDPAENLHRAIVDHIAGMTDRCAEREYNRLSEIIPPRLPRKKFP
jgi:dGTPase